MRILSIFLALLFALPARGHEFWISPVDYTLNPGETLVAQLRVGQKLEGVSLRYFPDSIARFDMIQGQSLTKITGRAGDKPALRTVMEKEGLAILIHETTDNRLTYQEWETFTEFVAQKDLTGTLEEHAARGLPETGFKEDFRRFAKALVAVGHARGFDRPVGLRTEIVARANPYIDDMTAGLPVTVFYEGKPRADTQVEVFAKSAEGEVEVTTFRTDQEGNVTIPVQPNTEYLIDAVKMLPMEAPDPAQDPVWLSLWAALTFRTP